MIFENFECDQGHLILKKFYISSQAFKKLLKLISEIGNKPDEPFDGAPISLDTQA